MIKGALDIWSVDPGAHKNEVARSTFVKGKVFSELGKSQKTGLYDEVCFLLPLFSSSELGAYLHDEIVII